MREIKFRAWFKPTKKMYQVGQVTLQKGTWNYEPEDREKIGVCIPYQPSFELMQYTGLHDKNGKEIYEGDIVKIKYRKGFKFGEPIYQIFIAKVTYEPKYASFIIENCKPSTVVHECENLGDYEDIEVIGDIYEKQRFIERN